MLVNNAVITRDNLLFKMSTEDWDAVLGASLRGSLLLTRATQKHMVAAGWGRIVKRSSASALGNRGQANHAAAEAGLLVSPRRGPRSWASSGLAVNATAPGYIAADMTRATADRIGKDWEQFLDDWAADIPVGRVGWPGDVAYPVSFFVSEGAGFTSGQVLYVAGGPHG